MAYPIGINGSADYDSYRMLRPSLYGGAIYDTRRAGTTPSDLSTMSDWDVLTIARSGKAGALEAQAEMRRRAGR